MEAISINPFVDKGIVVYFPSLERISNYLIKIEVFYSPDNPLFDWVNCNNSEVKIWEEITKGNEDGILFIYQSQKDLVAGFYTIKATLLSQEQPRVGKLTIGLIQPTPYLAIGVPYSMYPPMSLI